LEEYEYEVKYKKGSSNTNSDALSRLHVTEDVTDGQNVKPEPTEQEKLALFRDMHDKPLGAHLGMNRTCDRINLFTFWPGMKQDLEEYIKQCDICQRNQITQNKTKLPMKITTTPEVFWDMCALDIVGPLNQTDKGH
jgi:hypothetical protein